jgi:3-dehydroquinate synthase
MAMIRDADLFRTLEAHAEALIRFEQPVLLGDVIRRSIELKGQVVGADERESGLRIILNYGHTIGHALEAVTGYTRWTHGEAVALGIVAEAHLARRLGLADAATVAQQERLLDRLGLPVRASEVDPDAVLTAITHDKKARDGRVPFVLAPRLGDFRVVYDVPPAEVRAVLRDLAA